MKKWITYTLSLLTLVGSWVGCARPEEDIWRSDEEKEIPVVFNLNISDMPTRAMLPEDEEHIETIDVLAFVKSGSDYIFSYRREGKNYSDQDLNFTVDLISYSPQQILVVLVNARTELSAAGILTSDNVESALAKILVESDSEWPAGNGSSGTRYIPMTGISDATVITQGMTVFPSSVELYRMLGRINISLASGVSNFVLETAQVFNRVTKGYAGYIPALWNGKTAWVPTNLSGKPYKSYLPTVIYQADGSGNNSNITNKIYILESTGVRINDYLEGTAVVVGGTYTPSSGTPRTVYYRIDLTPNGLLSSSSKVDVVRNRSYNVVIQSVKGPGAETPQEAYEGVISLSAEVEGWTDNGSDVIIDGQYFMKLSQAGIAIGTLGNKLTITAETNYDGATGFTAGAVVDDSSLGDWASATIGPDTGSGGVHKYEIEVVIDTIPDGFSDDSRWSYFVIKAGNMNHQMAIWQWNGIWLSADTGAGFAPGSTRHALKLTNWKWQWWYVASVDDPDGILLEAQSLVGRSGGGKYNLDPDNGVGEDYLYFYVKPGAVSGKTATLTFANVDNDNPPVKVTIKAL